MGKREKQTEKFEIRRKTRRSILKLEFYTRQKG